MEWINIFLSTLWRKIFSSFQLSCTCFYFYSGYQQGHLQTTANPPDLYLFGKNQSGLVSSLCSLCRMFFFIETAICTKCPKSFAKTYFKQWCTPASCKLEGSRRLHKSNNLIFYLRYKKVKVTNFIIRILTVRNYTNSQWLRVVNQKIYHKYFLFTTTKGSGELEEIWVVNFVIHHEKTFCFCYILSPKSRNIKENHQTSLSWSLRSSFVDISEKNASDWLRCTWPDVISLPVVNHSQSEDTI